jgi:hypothetical protein
LSSFRGRALRALSPLLLIAFSIGLGYAILEFAFFRLLLPQLSVELMPFLPGSASVLVQDSKSGFQPRNYVALLGDSYALGVGDWLLEARSKGTKPFHSAHIIQAATGRDVVSFGREGYGSAQALVYEPSRIFPDPPCWALPVIEPPRDMFVYFYEGNDVNDDAAVVTYAGRAFGREDERAIANYLQEDLAFTPSWWQCRTHLAAAIERMAMFAYQVRIRGVTLPVNRPIENTLVVAGRRVGAPALQGPALNFATAGIERAMPVLGQSLAWITERLPRVPITVVYLPSPLSVYRHAGDTVAYQLRAEPSTAVPAARVTEHSDLICSMVRAVSVRRQVGFLDTRPALRAAAATTVIHGPRDWYHFNEAGYRVLGNLIVERLRSGGGPDACS